MKEKTIVYLNIRSDLVERVTPVFKAEDLDLNVLLLVDHGTIVSKHINVEVVNINTYNFDEVKEFLERYSLKHDLVGITTWGDKDVELVAYLCAHFKLPGNTIDAAKKCRNKYLMREAVSRIHPELCPKFYKIDSFGDLKKHYSPNNKYVLKPVGASGSKAIIMLEPNCDLEYHWRNICKLTQSNGQDIYSYFPNQYILERFIAGQEFSFDGLVQNRELYSAAVTLKDVTSDFSIEYNAFTNGDFSEKRNALIKSASSKAILALGINNSGFHLEGRIDGESIKIIEVAARPGGGYIASHLIQNATGIDYTAELIRTAIGSEVKWDKTKKLWSGQNLILPNTQGVLEEIKGVPTALEIKNIDNVFINKQIGDSVVLPPESFSIHIGAVLGTASTLSELRESLMSAINCIKIHIK